MCMGILFACTSVRVCAPVPTEARRDLDTLELELQADTCKLLYGFWEPNPHPLQEQPVLLSTEPSL